MARIAILVSIMLAVDLAYCQTAPSPRGASGIGCTVEGWYVSLTDQYGVYCTETERSLSEWGRLSVVRKFSSTGVALVVPGVLKVGVHGKVIFGTCNTGFFIVQTKQNVTLVVDEDVQIFESESGWKQAMRGLGISGDVHLSEPDAMASTRPATELQPYKFRIFQNLLFLSDDAWGVVFIAAALFVSTSLGLKFGQVPFLGVVALLLGGLAGFYLLFTPGEVMCGSTVIFLGFLSWIFFRLGRRVRLQRLARLQQRVNQ